MSKCKICRPTKKIAKKAPFDAYRSPDDGVTAMLAGITVKELRAHRKAEDMEGKPKKAAKQPAKKVNRRYKVWVQIEELTDEGEPTGNDLPVLPDAIGIFDDIHSAMKKVARVVHAFGTDQTIQTSDSVAGLPDTSCKKCSCDLDKDGHCTDEACPYSDRDQDDLFIEG